MKHALMLAPIGLGVGLTTVAFGFVRALENQGLNVSFLDLVTHNHEEISEFDEEKILAQFDQPLSIHFVEHMLSQGQEEKLLEFFVAHVKTLTKEADIVVIQGIISTQMRTYAASLNNEIARALDSEVIFVATPGGKGPKELGEQIEIAAQEYGGLSHPRVVGCIFNKVGAPVDQYGNARMDLFDPPEPEQGKEKKPCALFKTPNFSVLGCISWKRSLMAPRVKDIAEYLGAEVLFDSKIAEHRVLHFGMAAATIEHMTKVLKPDVLVITSGDRSDVIVATCMASLNGVHIAGLLLTGGHRPEPNTTALCERAIAAGLPVLSVKTDSLRTCIALQSLNTEIPSDDEQRLEEVKEYVASFIDKEWMRKLSESVPERFMSPPAFRFQLIEMARAAHKRIVLPEGDEPRILEAANRSAKRSVAQCVILGCPENVKQMAKDHGITLEPSIEIIDPETVREKYVAPLVKLRQHKGLTEKDARESLQEHIVLGTMMLAEGDVDGLVAGSNTTTANTVRPALKIIKTPPDVKLVSSVFFMCLPTQVLVYGDCAVNQNPSVEELADIAIQSAESAERFGITPRVAMISYSTGKSGKGADVAKIEQATELVKKKRPDLLVDGPLQYDAAFSPEVAKKKAPNSPVAGKATVYVFPDLNTANTTYKAVQRSAGVLSIGPMLQGLKKPVNDLSRGATVDDILYTIALTAIQAS